MRPRLTFASLGILFGFSLLYACVGDEPDATPDGSNGGDSGTDAPSSIDGGSGDSGGPPPGTDAGADASEAGATSCAGQPFDSPVPVNIGFASAFTTIIWGPRRLGNTAYFAGLETGGVPQHIYKATYTPPATPGGAPSLSDFAALGASAPSEIEWAPAVPQDGSFIVFSRGGVPARDLWVGVPGANDFTASGAIAALNSGGDEADPWVAGTTNKALYWGRAPAGGDMAIQRASITPGAPPTFGAAVPLGLTCPLANCGTPVVTPDEKILLFGTWAAGSFVPSVREIALTSSGGGVGPTGDVISHANLGTRYPSWISPDGCEVLLGSGAVTDLAYARRTPK